jgi:hypothetical protein
MQWVAWQAVPPECPNCSHQLRPESAPALPWVQSIPRVNMTMPSMPTMKMPEWKTPTWLQRRQQQGYDNLFVDEQDRYRDEPTDGEPSTQP